MLQVLEDAAASVAVPLLRGGEPFVADANTVRWSLRDETGAPMAGYQNQLPASQADTIIIVDVPGAANAIPVDKRFAKRTVIVTGKIGGVEFITRSTYRVTPFLNHSVTPDAVRAFIGVSSGELPDDDIDLAKAYYEIEARVTDTVLEAALASGTVSEGIANDAIKAQAVLSALPGMRARLAKREEDGTLKLERFPVDLDMIRDDAMRLIAKADLLVPASDDTSPAPTLFVLAGPATDAITGDEPT